MVVVKFDKDKVKPLGMGTPLEELYNNHQISRRLMLSGIWFIKISKLFKACTEAKDIEITNRILPEYYDNKRIEVMYKGLYKIINSKNLTATAHLMIKETKSYNAQKHTEITKSLRKLLNIVSDYVDYFNINKGEFYEII